MKKSQGSKYIWLLAGPALYLILHSVPAEKTIALGKKIIDYQRDLTVEAIKNKLK